MKKIGKLEIYWFILIAITLFNTFIGENFDTMALATSIIALTVMYKGLVVIDHFMELKEGHKNLRFLMRAYLIIFPSLIILTIFY